MNNQQPVVLIYKRTHKGDPYFEGVFGRNECMGQVRNWEYDAVIGIGGKRPDSGHEKIAFKINYIGIGAKKGSNNPRDGWPHVVFDKFCLYDEEGELVDTIAPELYKHMYDVNRRVVKSDSLSEDIYKEVLEILKLAENSPPSVNYEVVMQGLNPSVEKKLPLKMHPAMDKVTKGCR